MTEGSEETLDIDHLRSWIGREIAAEDIVSTDLVRKYRATLNLQPRPNRRRGDEAPPLVTFLFGPTGCFDVGTGR